MIDYERAKRMGPKLKASLTRALNQKDPQQRRMNVLAACRQAIAEWNRWGAWPDNWSRWERALADIGLPLVTLNDLDEGRA